MKKFYVNKQVLVIALFLGMIHFSCFNESPRIIYFPKTDLASAELIPIPVSISATSSGFPLDHYTQIATQNGDQELEKVGRYLSDKIKQHTALDIPVNEKENTESKSIIIITLSDQINSPEPEAYQLDIEQNSIKLSASSAAGAFRGIQTIRQLIPQASNDTLTSHPVWVIPTGSIADAPRFEYRSTMLDVSRHFFSVEDVKNYIDILSYYKYNVFHMHLSDDQGWRIEIKSWPRLTEIGGQTEVGGASGGFYTQEEFKEIIDYAADRHIMIVPEIDMPGHTNAASVAYPFLNGNGKTPELYEGTDVGFSTFDTRKDSVYTLIDDVVREISMLCPGPYFHIGGDESHVTQKNDYIYFVNRVEKIVQKYGKRMIGWDEISTADVGPTSIAQVWASIDNMETAVSKGMKVILSPAKKAYLDMKYDVLSRHGLSWAAYIPVDSGYIWDPESYAPKESILGIEAPLWSETISNLDELEYLAFPRAIGYAELSWSTEANRDWDNYKRRLAKQAPFLKRMNIDYYPSTLIEWENNDPNPTDQETIN